MPVVNTSTSPMPVENTVMLKNSMTHTAHSERNAVFTLLASWRVVKGTSPRRYAPGARVSSPMTNPASAQNSTSVPTSMSTVARKKRGSSSMTSPLSMSCWYATANSATATTNAARHTHGLRTATFSFFALARSRAMSW